MSNSARKHSTRITPPRFEDLEQRLLLTTLHGGEFFVYLNSYGEAVRVGLEGNSTDAVELLTAFDVDGDDALDLIGLPGLIFGDPTFPADWPDGNSVVEFNEEDVPSWVEYSEEGIRGAATEIFAIYVSQASEDTVLTISTLAVTDLDSEDWDPNNISPWESSSLPILFYIDDTAYTSPDGSGGVIVGAEPNPTEDDPRGYIVTSDSVSGLPLGVFPGGELHPGITVSEELLTIISSDSDEGLGQDVQAIAMNAAGTMYVVDLGAFLGIEISDSSTDVLGAEVDSLAGVAGGNAHAVDNVTFGGGEAILDDSDATVDLGDRVHALASTSGGTIYGVNETTHGLLEISATGATTAVGLLIDHVVGSWRYDNVTALTVDSSDALYSLATVTATGLTPAPVPTASGQFLITINASTARVQQGVELDALMLGMAIDTTSDTFYGITATNLYQIDTTTGVTTDLGALLVGVDPVVGGIGSITFIEGQLYGVSPTALYAIDKTSGACTLLSDPDYATGLAELSSLAYDPNEPLGFWASYQILDADDNPLYSSLARIHLSSSLGEVVMTTGGDNLIGLLTNAASTFSYRNIHALNMNETGLVLYGVGQSFELATGTTSAPLLFTIDTSNGEVTEGPSLAGGIDLDSLAFDSSGTLYGVNPDGTNPDSDDLVTVNTGTGAITVIGTFNDGVDDIDGIKGIEFITIGANDALFAVSGSDLYAVDETNADVTLLGDTGQTDLTSLTFDADEPGVLWSTRDMGDYSRLVRIDLSSTLGSTTEAGNTQRLALLFDDTGPEPAYGYENVHALEFDGAGTLYGVGTIINIDPYHVADPANFGPYLITIDTTTGEVTQIGLISGDAGDLSTLAFDGTATWYGVDPVTDTLVTVDETSGATTNVAILTDPSVPVVVTGVTGIDFVDTGIANTLYAVTADTLYTVDPATAFCTEIGPVGGIGTALSSLTNDPNNPDQLFSTSPAANGVYQLVKIWTDTDLVGYDFGRMIIGGTVSGEISTPKSIDVIEMGFLWGNVTVDQNLGDIILRNAGGAMPASDYTHTPDNGSLIHVGGTLNMVDSRSGTLYTAIEAENDPGVADPGDVLFELEVFPGGMEDPAIDAAWLDGDLIDYSNGSVQNAQFLTHPTGYFTLVGELPLISDVLDTSDWYAFGLMAGQTIAIDGSFFGYAVLYDSFGFWMESFGYETIEDYGVGSRGLNLEPITFTAPAAGVYYLEVVNPFPFGIDYQLAFSNATAASLGGVNVVGDYDGSHHFGTGDADGANIAVKSGGDLGAVVISNESLSTVAAAFGGGDLVAFQAAQLGHFEGGHSGWNQIVSEGSVGMVAAMAGFLDASIEAGANNGFYDNDAHIQNIYAATNLVYLNDISATGSIGVIELGGSFALGLDDFVGGVTVTLNSDSAGPGGKCDLIDVAEDLYAPLLQHGPGGNFGYIHVGGTIYVDFGAWWGPLIETAYTDGRTTVLNDDGGGQLRINPEKFDTGLRDQSGHIIYTYTSYAYSIIPVDDTAGGIGGVIANLTIDDSVGLNATGMIHISDLDLDSAASDSAIILGGSGTTDLYYVHGGQIGSFINNTPGRLVSGSLGSIGDETLRLAGDLGVWDYPGSTGAWLFGHDAATGSGYNGWFHGRQNGLLINGDLPNAWIGGSLGDLSVTGEIGTLRVNADGIASGGAWNDWDGINGVVWAGTRINTVYVGDGLADDGGSDLAKAAIFSGGSIGSVYISGPRYEQSAPSGEGLDETLKRPMVFGELNGSIFAMSNDLVEIVPDWRWPNITEFVEVDAISQVIGTDGAVCTALIAATTLDSFQCFLGSFVDTGSVGTVSFSGPGAEIYGSEVYALYIGKISTSANSDGISHSYFSGTSPEANGLTIGQVLAGGPGMYSSVLSSNGGNIGSVKGVGPVADIWDCEFTSTAGMNYIGARDIHDNEFHMPGELKQFNATADVEDNEISVGALGTLNAGGDFVDNEVTVAGVVKSIDVDGYFDSVLTLQGPSTAYLQSLTVAGNIAGTITSAGKIGQIISRTGAISADISTLLGGWETDVDLIQTALGYTGGLDINGSLKKFTSYVSLGDAPTAPAAAPQTFNIGGDLDYLKVGRVGTAHLYANLNVGGDVGTMDIDGTFYSNTTINGNLNKLILDGALGGQIGGTDYGSLTVYGYIKSMRFNAASDLAADLTVGGSINRLALNGGSILGDITSLYGSLGNISVNNGSIDGALTAASIGNVRVNNGSVTGDIATTNGSIKSIQIRNGDLDADVHAVNGWITTLNISGGDATAGHTIEADAGIGNVIIVGGDLDADLISGGIIKNVTIRGSDLNGMINAEGEIWALNIAGAINDTVRSGGQIKRITAGSLNNAIISSAWNIVTTMIRGNVVGSHLLAGYDIGDNGIIDFAGDDNPLNSGTVHSGTFKSLTIIGAFDASVVAAGYSPGADDDYLTAGDNAEADGQSDITRMTIGGGYLNTGSSAILADTSVYGPLATQAAAAGVTVTSGVVAPLAGTGTDFGPGAASGTTTNLAGDLILTLGGAGIANYAENFAPGIDRIVLEETTARSSLTIRYTGVGAYGNTIEIVGSDDSGLATLRTIGNVTLGDVQIDGSVRSLMVGDVDDGSTWDLPGGVNSARLSTLTDVDITAGEVGTWNMTGAFNSTGPGNLTADAIRSFMVVGNMQADLTTLLGDAATINIRNGSLTGNLDIRGTVRNLMVTNALAGDVTVNLGDLYTIRAASLSGSVDVSKGMARTVTISVGDFSGQFISAMGISNFNVSRGDFSGLLSTGGDLRTLQAPRGEMSGSAVSGGSINRAMFASMDGGFVAASADLLTVIIRGDMIDSWLFAGFDPGDDLAIGGAGDDADVALGGTIKTVTISGDMGTSTVSGAVSPGDDGYVGTADDLVGGTGYVYRVTVFGRIYGNSSSDESYGVYAASNMPTVYHHRNQPFSQNLNARVDTMASMAGNLLVTDVRLGYNFLAVEFNHPLNFGTIDATTFTLLVSVDDDFATLGDNTDLSTGGLSTITYDSDTYTVALTLVGDTWETLGLGGYYQLTIDGTLADDADQVADIRGNILDGEFTGTYPSGNGWVDTATTPDLDNDFVWTAILADMADDFDEEVLDLSLTVDGGTIVLSSAFETDDDVDIFSFAGTQFEYFAVDYNGPLAEMGLFFHDDQDTVDTSDDFFEALTRYEYMELSTDTIFQAFELPETGDYYLAVTTSLMTWSPETGTYQLALTMSSSDTNLVADLGGSLPTGEEIAYVSNAQFDNNNNLGWNDPRQLVYLDFDGGTATKYNDDYGVDVDVEAFDSSLLDAALAGYENDLINGGTVDSTTITGIVDNMISIFTNTAATHPDSPLNAVEITTQAQWNAATEGLYFTTVDPATWAVPLDPETDFTTVFIGEADEMVFGGGLYGIASDIDLANLSKADNALVFTQTFAGDSFAGTTPLKLNEYSRALANVAAHELGHTLGLNHQPTNRIDYDLLADDPDNVFATADDSNTGAGLMAYTPRSVMVGELSQLGTAPLTDNEFAVGWLDTQDLLLRWLA